jgi:hypothetical protein
MQEDSHRFENRKSEIDIAFEKYNLYCMLVTCATLQNSSTNIIVIYLSIIFDKSQDDNGIKLQKK